MADLTARAYRVIKEVQPGATVVAASTGSRSGVGLRSSTPPTSRVLAARGWPVDVYAVRLLPAVVWDPTRAPC